MKTDQISIFLENKPGRLATVTKTLADDGIDIRALSLADTEDFGVLRLIVNNPEKAFKTLAEAGFRAKVTPMVAVEVPDNPGGLWKILSVLDEAQVNVEYMYAFVGRCGNAAIIMFRLSDIDKGIEVLGQKGFTLLSGQKIYSM